MEILCHEVLFQVQKHLKDIH